MATVPGWAAMGRPWQEEEEEEGGEEEEKEKKDKEKEEEGEVTEEVMEGGRGRGRGWRAILTGASLWAISTELLVAVREKQ